MSMGSPPLSLSLAVQEAICARWREARSSGREPCGFLLGVASVGVLAERAAKNAHAQPERAFWIAPEERLAALRVARARGQEILGVWHGHLDGAAMQSPADREGAGADAPSIMLIAGNEGEHPPRLKAWRRHGAAWTPCRIELV
ncbi:MAG: Mov34/MPN/PAD-1 family protein [Planctomycetota bacterium]|nr:Mov34/MPN/PAD-1 family protein [Planctomycetota bacterium]